MEFVLINGVNWYYANDAVPKAAQHKMNFLVGKFGSNLDAAPKWATHVAQRLMSRFGLLN